jgi:hypothetical protein
MRVPLVASSATLAALAVGLPAGAQVTIVREPLYALDGRAIVNANKVIARTRFSRARGSSIPHELAVRSARTKVGTVGEFERFFSDRLDHFLADARSAGLRTDDAGDARAYFIQLAFKIYNGRGFGDPAPESLRGSELWGGGAIAAAARSEAWLARFEFVERIKFVMGKNPRFAALSAAGKQRVYDYYALAAQLLTDSYLEAQRTGDRRERSLARHTAQDQLRLDLGVDPNLVHFTATGIEVE